MVNYDCKKIYRLSVFLINNKLICRYSLCLQTLCEGYLLGAVSRLVQSSLFVYISILFSIAACLHPAKRCYFFGPNNEMCWTAGLSMP